MFPGEGAGLSVPPGWPELLSWQGLKSFHQAPEGWLNPTLQSLVLPWHKPPAVGRGLQVAGSLSYSSVNTAASSQSHLGHPEQRQAQISPVSLYPPYRSSSQGTFI